MRKNEEDHRAQDLTTAIYIPTSSSIVDPINARSNRTRSGPEANVNPAPPKNPSL